jgi:hypothetical protein
MGEMSRMSAMGRIRGRVELDEWDVHYSVQAWEGDVSDEESGGMWWDT